MNCKLTLWESKNLLLKHLSTYRNHVIIGNDIEASRGYYSYDFGEKDNSVAIGILVNQPKKPSLFPLSKDGVVLIAHDQSLSGLNFKNGHSNLLPHNIV